MSVTCCQRVDGKPRAPALSRVIFLVMCLERICIELISKVTNMISHLKAKRYKHEMIVEADHFSCN
jgi:hypothetical protein